MEIPGITFPILGDFTMNFLPYFTVFGWKIYWYGVIIAVGFLLAVLYGVRRAPSLGFSEDDLIDTLLWAVPLGIIGARLYYVIFYRDGAGLNPYFDGEHDLRDIVSLWEGGLAIYGGVIGGAVGLVIATKRKKISTRGMLDLISFGLLIGQAVGRWGNFTNREAYGTETLVPWRMGLVYSYGTFYYHPTFLYESLWNFLGFLLLHFWTKKHRRYDGQVFLSYLTWYGLGRLFIEGLRTDSLYLGTSNLRVSQLLAGATCLAGAALLLYFRIFRHPEPEELWVNRNKPAEKAEEKAVSAPVPAMTDEEFDEELSDAFRILSGGRAAEEEKEEAGEREEPFTLPEEVAELFEKPETAEAPGDREKAEAGASPAAEPESAEKGPAAEDGITQD